ncbi:MAG: SGNH/GDSL hydrolase family protein [Gemmatimonadales bacterium]
MFRAVRLGLAILLLAACSVAGPGSSDPDFDGDPSATFRILFIGNSLTYVNDVPGLVKALADSAGVERTFVASVAYPDYGLIDHWNLGPARSGIAHGNWRFVVMQQGPSALDESRVQLLDYAGRFAGDIAAVGATPAMYGVWPSQARSFDFARSIESYRLAAEAIDGRSLPAGAAWLEAWNLAPSLSLYGGDGFHPSAAGSYLAALTIFGGLYDRSVVGLPAALRTASGTVSLDPATALLLQQAADKANGR